MHNTLRVEGLSVSYGSHLAVREATVNFTPGSITGILGPNGAGKTTLVRAMLGLVRAQAGSVMYAGKELRQSTAGIGYVPQKNSVDWDFPATVYEVVEMGTLGAAHLKSRARKREAVAQALARVGAQEFSDRPIGALSGGQKQRVFLARALVKNPPLLVLDEPFAGVDAPSEAAIIQVLDELKDSGATIIMVHHDLSTAPKYFSHVVLFNTSVVAQGRTEDTLTNENLTRTYGGPLSLLTTETTHVHEKQAETATSTGQTPLPPQHTAD